MTIVQVPDGTTVSTQGNIMSSINNVMLNKDAPLSSLLADCVL